MSKLKIFLFLCCVGLASWGGYKFYHYFFDLTSPAIIVAGIEDSGCYCGDVQCTVAGRDSYKIASISIWLDKKPLVVNHIINKKECEYVFPIATKTLPDGEHDLKIIVTDSSFRKNATTRDLRFTVDNVPLRAAFVTSDAVNKIFQGKTLHVQFQVNKPVKEAFIEVLSNRYPCIQEGKNSPVYECFVPIRSDEKPNEHIFTVHITDNAGNKTTLTNKLQIVMYPFKKQRLTVKSEKLKKEEELGLPEKQLETELEALAKKSPQQKLWKGSFYVPCDLTGISTAFGTLRTTQERGKYRHNALDLLSAPRSVIWACQDGVVVLKDRYVHSGNTVVIDHGCGVLSLYFHLDKFADINVGDRIKKGKPLGTLGMTGYASGYHLHWELRVNNTPVDPMQWTKHDF